MSNQQLTVATFAVLVAHLLAIGAALLLKRGPVPVAAVNLVLAMSILVYLASRPQWVQTPIDWPLAALAGFELLVLGAAILTFRRFPPAVVVSWAVFALHLLASAAAVIFVLSFKINRLI